MTRQTHVIVGASLAGATAAATLRKEGFDGRIVLIGDEDERPYERPKLSKEYLRGEPDVDVYAHPPGFYEENDVELLTGWRVDSIDARLRTVTTAGEKIGFDRLLIATGAAPRSLDLPSPDFEGVVTLRTRHDSDALRERALKAESIVVVGGGWIAAEVAASLRQLGRQVTLVMPGHAPLERVLGPAVASIYLAAHERNGVKVVAGMRVVGFDGEDRVRAVRTDAGERLPADLVVLGIGVRPRAELADAAGLDVDDGILVDEQLETGAGGIFAAGDVANALHPRYGTRLRVEHWDNAKRQGRAAALNMLGQMKPYDRIPYFYSDQYDLGMEYRGHAPEWDDVVFRGDPASGKFLVFWLRDRAVAAAMNVNIWDAGKSLEALLAAAGPVDRRALADESAPLADLAGVHA